MTARRFTRCRAGIYDPATGTTEDVTADPQPAPLTALLMEHEPGADYGYETMICTCGWVDADAVGLRKIDPTSKTWLEHILATLDDARLTASPAAESGELVKWPCGKADCLWRDAAIDHYHNAPAAESGEPETLRATAHWCKAHQAAHSAGDLIAEHEARAQGDTERAGLETLDVAAEVAAHVAGGTRTSGSATRIDVRAQGTDAAGLDVERLAEALRSWDRPEMEDGSDRVIGDYAAAAEAIASDYLAAIHSEAPDAEREG